MTRDRYGTPIYDPDDEPTWCPHGVQLDAPWWCRERCHACEVEACAETGHVDVGDVQDDRGVWHGTCECGEKLYPFGGWSPDDDGNVEANR
jgi:hypothetical protein